MVKLHCLLVFPRIGDSRVKSMCICVLCYLCMLVFISLLYLSLVALGANPHQLVSEQ